MFKVVAFLSLFAAGAVHAAECKVDYKIQYRECPNPAKLTPQLNNETRYLLVVEGAKNTFDAQCGDHGAVTREYPGAKNIRFNGRDDRDPPVHRIGVNRRDVWCKYIVDVEVPVVEAQPACGIHSASGACAPTDISFVNQCIDSPSDSEDQRWQKAGCLVDSIKAMQAKQIKISEQPALYGAAKVELQMLEDKAASIHSPNDIRLIRVLSQSQVNYK